MRKNVGGSGSVFAAEVLGELCQRPQQGGSQNQCLARSITFLVCFFVCLVVINLRFVLFCLWIVSVRVVRVW